MGDRFIPDRKGEDVRMKWYKWMQFFLYILAAIAIFIFRHEFMGGVGYLVGGVVMVYSVEEFCVMLAQKKYAHLAGSVIQGTIALLLILTADDLARVCVIWGVWSIIREGRELTEAILHLKTKRLAILDVAESVVVLVLSVFLVMEPGEHHAYAHLILLGIELILEVTFPLMEKLVQRRLPFDKREDTEDR